MALRWLQDSAPADVAATLVQGDLRNGNLLVHLDLTCAAPLTGVLVWELAHLWHTRLAKLAVDQPAYDTCQRFTGGC